MDPRRWRRALALLGAACLLAGACTRPARPEPTASSTRQDVRLCCPALPSRVGAPTDFVATRGDGRALVIASARTGAVRRVLHRLPWDGMTVTRTAIDRHGTIWVSLERGPTYLGHIFGGDPQPGTCASRVVTIDPMTGAVRTVLRGNDRELIGGAAPSPDGRSLVYLKSGCATGYSDAWIGVKDLVTGATRQIGAGLPRCHWLSDLNWTADGSAVVTSYAAARRPSYTGPQGTCSEPLPAVMDVIPVTRAARGLPGRIAPADPGCEFNAAVPTDDGFAAIEHCGADGFLDGPVWLVRFTPSMHRASRWRLGRCEDGADLAVDASGRDLLAATYQFCNPPGTTQPVTDLDVDHGHGPSRIALGRGGDLGWSDLAW